MLYPCYRFSQCYVIQHRENERKRVYIGEQASNALFRLACHYEAKVQMWEQPRDQLSTQTGFRFLQYSRQVVSVALQRAQSRAAINVQDRLRGFSDAQPWTRQPAPILPPDLAEAFTAV